MEVYRNILHIAIVVKDYGYNFKQRRVKVSFNRVKKVNPRICCDELYTYISANSSLTKPQVRECFKVYADMLEQLTENKYADRDLTIILPYIGQFHYVKKKGKKGGSTYIIPEGLASKNLVTRTIEEDRPDYYILKFRVFGKMARYVKEKTRVKNGQE